MKGVVIFDKSNDIAFLQANDELRIYLNRIAIARGLIEPLDVRRPLDRDVIMQVLSPFMTSQRFMNDVLKTTYHSIQTENGHLFVFMQFDEQIYIAINGDGTETEMFLTRKLSVLNRIIRFILGPVLDELKPENLAKRSERWQFIGLILSTWCQLHDTEQAFLVEAPERLHINPDLNGKCVGFLEWAFSAIKSKEDGAIHSMLLINNKLLSLFSHAHAPAVDVSDQMMIIILVQSLFSNFSLKESTHSSPLSRISQSSSHSEQDLGQDQIESSTPSDDVSQSTSVKNDFAEGESLRNENRAAAFPFLSKEGPKMLSSGGEDMGSSTDESLLGLKNHISFEKRIVFLRSGSTNNVPHLLHCVPVTMAITLVFVCQISYVEDSTALVRLLEILHLILHVSWRETVQYSSATAVLKVLDSSVKAILNMAQRYGNSEMVGGPVKMLVDKWKEVNTPALLVQLEEAKPSRPLDQRVRFDLQQMYSLALNLFYRLFFLPRAMTADEKGSQTELLREIQVRLRASLNDYAKFLHAKSLNNLTLTSYLELYPGMIHFLYVDRTSNQMTGTSFAVGSNRKSNQVQCLIIKKNMWNLMELIHQNLLQGCTMTLVRKGDYYYSYSLWFEDTAGKSLTTQVPSSTPQRFLLPGIIAHNFYKKLVSRCFARNEHLVNCYELITVHTANMPKSLMHDQRQKLTARLVQASAVSSSPLPLF